MDPTIISALIGGGANVVGSGLGVIGAGRRMEKQARLQRKNAKWAMDYQNQMAKENFEAYQSPEAQRRMLEDAGLLGASLFGGASAGSPSVGAQAAGGDAPMPTQTVAPADFSGIGQGISDTAMKIAELKLKDAQAQNLGAQTLSEEVRRTLLSAQTNLANTSAANTRVQTDLAKVSLTIERALQQSRIDMGMKEVDLLTEKIDIAKAEWRRLANKNSLFEKEREIMDKTISQMDATLAFTVAQTWLQYANVEVSNQQAALFYQMAVGQSYANVQEKANMMTQFTLTGENARVMGVSDGEKLYGWQMRLYKQFRETIREAYGAEMEAKVVADFENSKSREVIFNAMRMVSGLAVLGAAGSVGSAIGSNVSRKVPILYGSDGKAIMWSH